MGALTEPCVVPIGVWQSTGVQVGGVPLQVRSAWQVCTAVPDRLYPELHAYVAVELNVDPVVVGEPLLMPGGARQSAGPQVGEVPLQLPSAWQVRGEVPASPNPVWQVYVAVEPKVVFDTDADPLAGLLTAPQSTIVQVGSAAFHVPSGWQVRVNDPEGL
jgi:hypothetical protein